MSEYKPLTPLWKQYDCDPANPAHRAQAAFVNSKALYRCLPCGRSGGKSDLCLRQLIYCLVDPNGGARKPATGEFTHNAFAFCAPTYKQVKKIAWQRILDMIPKHWIVRINKSDLEIETLVNGVKSVIFLVGMDRPERFEGTHWWTGIIIDECSMIKPGTFESSIEPAILPRGAWVIFAGRPKRSGCGAGWFERMCQDGETGSDPDLATFHWKSTDLLDPDAIIRVKRGRDPKTFREEYEAEWLTTGGKCFYRFDLRLHKKQVAYDPSRLLHFSWDFNNDPMTGVFFHWDKHQNRMQVFDELFEHESYVQKSLDVIYAKYGQHDSGWIWHGDAASTQKDYNRQHGTPLHAYATIKADERFKFMQMQFARSNPHVSDRIASTNALLQDCIGTVSIEIDGANCPNLIKDLMARSLDEKTGAPSEGKSGDLIGHISDAFSYACHLLAPSTRISGGGKVVIP